MIKLPYGANIPDPHDVAENRKLFLPATLMLVVASLLD
jgi:hypothetical protein